jgi:chemotaxis protein MotA
MTSIGVFAPTFGIIGAVVGLIATLSHLDDPSKLGHGIASAFIATFWGVFLANGIFLPAANKLGRLSQDEAA